MILVTVGSMFPFDRLVQAMDRVVAAGGVDEEVVAQIGSGSYEPRSMSFERFMAKDRFDQLLSQASAVVSHAGVGTIATALARSLPMVVMPRRGAFGEHVNDHQVGTARRWAELGHVLVANEADDLPRMLKQLRGFTPRPRHVDAIGIARRVDRFLREGH